MSDDAPVQDNPVPYIIRLRERASRDIDAAYVRFAEMTSETIAEEWREGLLNAFADLTSMPRRFPCAPERFRREAEEPVRKSPNGNEIYDRAVRSQLEPQRNSEIIAIDRDIGAWEEFLRIRALIDFVGNKIPAMLCHLKSVPSGAAI